MDPRFNVNLGIPKSLRYTRFYVISRIDLFSPEITLLQTLSWLLLYHEIILKSSQWLCYFFSKIVNTFFFNLGKFTFQILHSPVVHQKERSRPLSVNQWPGSSQRCQHLGLRHVKAHLQQPLQQGWLALFGGVAHKLDRDRLTESVYSGQEKKSLAKQIHKI